MREGVDGALEDLERIDGLCGVVGSEGMFSDTGTGEGGMKPLDADALTGSGRAEPDSSATPGDGCVCSASSPGKESTVLPPTTMRPGSREAAVAAEATLRSLATSTARAAGL